MNMAVLIIQQREMTMHSIESLTRGIEWAQRGLGLMKRIEPNEYDHAEPSISGSECGTVCCTAGWMAVANMGEIGLMDDTEKEMKLTRPWRQYLFYYSCQGGEFSWEEGGRVYSIDLLHDEELSTARARVERWLQYARRKLAIMQVEAGHWGGVPVGEARERHLEEVLA